MQIYDKNATGFDSVIEPSLIAKIENGSSGSATLIEKTITENNTYNAADDGVSGYSSVTVNVATPTPETFDVTLNIEQTSSATSVNFSSSKTLQEALAAHTEGKILSFTVNWTNNGQTSTTTRVNYLYNYVDELEYFVLSFIIGEDSSFYPLLWASDNTVAILDATPVIIVVSQ